jgi:uroporphyrinogen-III synthase
VAAGRQANHRNIQQIVARKFYKVLCTRRLDDHWKEIAQQHQVILESHDFLSIKRKDPESFRASLTQNRKPLVFTSAHAVKAVASLIDSLAAKDCFCIEGSTRAAAERYGFHILDHAGDAQALAGKIIAGGWRGVIHCSTLNRRKELQESLAAAGIQTDFCEVYEKALAPLKVEAPDAVVFFSPSQIDAFLQANKLDKATPAFCIGTTTAGHLKATGHEHIVIAPRPDTKDILHTVFEHFKQA